MKSVGLVGFGISNKALCEHFLSLGYKVFVHTPSKCDLPSGVFGVFGSDYLTCNEDLVFRSPSVRPDCVRASAKIMCESEYSLSRLNIPKICVTGSDGKTTTVSLIYEILRQEYNAFLGGNIGNVLLNATLGNYDVAVCELSSFQLFDFSPNCHTAVITGITENHLNWHGSMDEYVSCKENILKNASRKILCYDNPYTRELSQKYDDAILFSLNDINHLGGKCVYLKDGFIYKGNEKIISRHDVLLRADFNLLNVMAAICACYDFVKKESLVSALKSFRGVKHRLELVKTASGVSFYNSSIDTTPSRTLATLSAFDKSKTVLILGGQDKNLSYEVFDGELDSLRSAVLLGENKNKILPHLKCKSIRVVNTLKEAVYSAFDMATSGDSILLSPASTSFDMFDSYEQRGNEFIKTVNELTSN